MKKKYLTKPMQCDRCKGTGLEQTGMYVVDCIMCQGKGERLVTMSAEEWAREEKNES